MIPAIFTGIPFCRRAVRTFSGAFESVITVNGISPSFRKVLNVTFPIFEPSARMTHLSELTAALKKRKNAGPEQREIYASYLHEAFLNQDWKRMRVILYWRGGRNDRHPRLSFCKTESAREINHTLNFPEADFLFKVMNLLLPLSRMQDQDCSTF